MLIDDNIILFGGRYTEITEVIFADLHSMLAMVMLVMVSDGDDHDDHGHGAGACDGGDGNVCDCSAFILRCCAAIPLLSTLTESSLSSSGTNLIINHSISPNFR